MSMLTSLVKWLAIVVVAIAVVLVGGGYILSPTFSVTRSVVIAAPADKVYALVADPRAWKQWSVWNQRDPAMKIEYSGPESGAGAVWAWHSASEGDGRMSFTAAEPGRLVAFDLYFPDFGTTSKGALQFTPEGNGTRVSWTMNGDFGSNPLMHWFALLADRITGHDFDAGLANLKAIAEKP
jgi:uncharacterized protein YndB with AHSA1/START domain